MTLGSIQRDEAEAAVPPKWRQRRVVDHCIERHAGTFNHFGLASRYSMLLGAEKFRLGNLLDATRSAAIDDNH